MSKNDKASADDKLVNSMFVYAIALTILLFVFKDYLLIAYFWLVEKEINMIYGVLRDLGIHSENLHILLEAITGKNNSWTLEQAQLVSKHADKYIVWIHLMYIFPLVITMTMMKRKTKYNRKFTGDSYIAEMAKTSPRIRPIVHLEFGQDDKDRGPFTWPQTPLEWSVERSVIKLDGTVKENKESFDPVKCKQEIIKDIETDVYRGATPDEMTLDRRFIFAVYSLWYENRFKEFNQLLDDGARWFTAKKQIFTKKRKYLWEVPEEWVKKINDICEIGMCNKRMKRIIDKHVFQDTVLKGLMEPIQKTAAPDYIWLKAINNKLFYNMHQTGNQTSFQICKGTSDIYELEKMLYIKGKRLVSIADQKALSKKDILNKIDLTVAVADTWFSLEKTGFMDPIELINYSDEQLKHMEDARESVKEIDITKPIYMFYHMTGGGQSGAPLTIKTIYFYDPENRDVLKEIETPRGHLEANDKPVLEWYLYNHYIVVADMRTVDKWLKARGIMEDIYFYDLLWDANEAYHHDGMGQMKTLFQIEKATGMTWKDLESKEVKLTIKDKYIEMYSRVMSNLKNQYLDVGIK